jgi:carboxypeptidase family protein
MYEEHKLSSTRFKAFSIPVLVILVLCIGLFSIAVSADWAKCVQARLDGVNAVRLLVTADEKGTVTFTIDKNVITFAVLANVKLDTGKLRIDEAKLVVAELSDAAGAVTARCTIPIEQLTPRDKPFCCDKTPPVIELTVTPNGDGKTVSWKIEDESSDVKECRVTLVANGEEHVLSSDCAGQRMLLASEFGAGTHEVHVRAIDEAGNEATASQKVVLSEPMCSISGQVIDANTRQPVAGVTVTLNAKETRMTDGQGRFSFSDLELRKHYLMFAKDGLYEYHTRGVTCRNSEGRSITVSLVPIPQEQPSCTIRGTVVDATTKQALPGVTVKLYEPGKICVTDSQGRFSFTDLEPRAHYDMEFTKAGYGSYGHAWAGVSPGESIEIPVELTPVQPEEPSITLSWTPDPADSSNEWTAHISETVTLYLRGHVGSQFAFCWDWTGNRDLPRMVFAGVTLGLSVNSRQEPADACLETGGCEYSVRFLAGGDSNYRAVDVQAYAVLSGNRILVSEVLTLYIQY